MLITLLVVRQFIIIEFKKREVMDFYTITSHQLPALIRGHVPLTVGTINKADYYRWKRIVNAPKHSQNRSINADNWLDYYDSPGWGRQPKLCCQLYC